MKKLFGCILVLFSAGALWAENSISMVTYFPVPYVAYNRVNPGSGEHNEIDEMAIGVTKKGGHLSLGSANLSDKPLDAAKTTLFGGKLLLNFSSSTITTERFVQVAGTELGDGTISVGDPSLPTTASASAERMPVTANLFFGNLHIKQVEARHSDPTREPAGPSRAYYSIFSSLNTKKLEVDDLSLFTKNFPSCYGANTELENRGQIAWTLKSLEGSDKARLYLTCGKVLTCSPRVVRGGDEQLCEILDAGRGKENVIVSGWQAVRSGGKGACGNKTPKYMCCLDESDATACENAHSLPGWVQTGDWDRTNCKAYPLEVVQMPTCDSFCPTDGGTMNNAVVTKNGRQSCVDGEVTVTEGNVNVSNCLETKDSDPRWCVGQQTRSFTFDGATCTGGAWSGDYYMWVKVGDVTVSSGTTDCSSGTSATADEEVCRPRSWFRAQHCTASNVGTEIRALYSACQYAGTNSSGLPTYNCNASVYSCTKFSDLYLVLNNDGTCKHHQN